MGRPGSWLAAVLVLTGCFDERLPSAVQIACGRGEDCPPGYLCRTSIARCVRSDSADLVPPALAGDVRVAPTVARAGALLSVEFAVDEALSSDPVVHVGGRALVVDEAGTDREARTWRYALRVSGTEPESVPVPVVVDLVDASGNLASGLSGGTAQFDFEPPVLLSSTGVAPPVAGVAGALHLTFSFGEALGVDPVVTMQREGGPAEPVAWSLESHEGGGAYAFGYTTKGVELEGTWTVSVVATDLAGKRT